MARYDDQITRLQAENRHDEQLLKTYEKGGSGGVAALFRGLAEDETHEQERLFRRMITHRKDMIAFYEQLNAKERV